MATLASLISSTHLERTLSGNMVEAGLNGYRGVLLLYHHVANHVIVKWTGPDVDGAKRSQAEATLLQLVKEELDAASFNTKPDIPFGTEVAAQDSAGAVCIVEHVELQTGDLQLVGSPVKVSLPEPCLTGPVFPTAVQVKGEEADLISSSQAIAGTGEDLRKADSSGESKVRTVSAITIPATSRGRRKAHSGDKPYTCSVCSKTFSQITNMKVHQRTHTGERPYECQVCNKTFTQVHSLKFHERIHTGEKPYQCPTCNKRFARLSNMKDHQRIHTGERPYQCTVCSKTFTLVSHLSRHKLLHTGDRPHQCTACDKTFVQAGHLKLHTLLHSGERPYECTHCDKKFTQSILLTRHMKNHADNVLCQSTLCDSKLTEHPDLEGLDQSHIDSISGICVTADEEEQELEHPGKTLDQREVDGEIFKVSGLELHTDSHASEGAVQGAMLALVGDDEEAQQVGTLEGAHECPVCSKAFTLACYLKRHMKIHSTDRPYQCDVCGKGFTQGSDLKRHNLTHSGEKPFQCSACTMTFSRSHNLKLHYTRAHTGLSIFQSLAMNMDNQ